MNTLQAIGNLIRRKPAHVRQPASARVIKDWQRSSTLSLAPYDFRLLGNGRIVQIRNTRGDTGLFTIHELKVYSESQVVPSKSRKMYAAAYEFARENGAAEED